MIQKFVAVATLSVCVLFSTLGRAQTPPVADFNFIAPGWTTPVNTIDMGQFWHPAGLQESGINYYLAGGPLSGATTWERFDPLSPRYQAWTGAYVVTNFQFANEWTKSNLQVSDIPNSISRVLELGVIDQLAWLTGFEDPAPLAQVIPSTVHTVKDSNGFFTVVALMNSHSDVGANVPFPFVPPPSPLVQPFAPVVLEIFLTFKYDPSHNVFLVAYASGTRWLVQGVPHQTPLFVFGEQAEMLSHLQF